jgi:hypothetical protein
METDRIVPIVQRDWVRKNRPLLDVLKETDEPVVKLTDYAIANASDGNEEEANRFICLIWPAILEGHDSTKSMETLITGEHLPAGKNAPMPNNERSPYFVKLGDGTLEQKHALDKALDAAYASRIRSIALRLVNEPRTPASVFYNLSYELLSVVFLTSDMENAAIHFSIYLSTFVGYHEHMEENGIIDRSADIVREVLKTLPKRGGEIVLNDPAPYNIENNILECLHVAMRRLEGEGVRKQAKMVYEIARVLCIHACKTKLSMGMIKSLLAEHDRRLKLEVAPEKIVAVV